LNIAITCDFLLEKSFFTEIIDVVCDVVPEAKIYTFAHRPKAIIGRIERRQIQSSVLSKKVISEKKFYQYPSFQFPLIAKNLFVACKYDLIINISMGLSQGFQKCGDTKQFTYLVDWGLENKFRNSFGQKFFYAYLKRFAVNSFNQVDYLWVANEKMQAEFPKGKIVAPPFKMHDYALFPTEMFPHNFYAIDTSDLDLELAQEIVKKFENENIPFQFVGKYSHLSNLVFKDQKNYFFGDRCSGEHAPVLAASKAFISFSANQFPRMALGALSTGRPVIIPENQAQWVKGAGVYFMKSNKLHGLTKAIEELEKNINHLKPDAIREQVNIYQENNFKVQLKEFLNSHS